MISRVLAHANTQMHSNELVVAHSMLRPPPVLRCLIHVHKMLRTPYRIINGERNVSSMIRLSYPKISPYCDVNTSYLEPLAESKGTRGAFFHSIYPSH